MKKLLNLILLTSFWHTLHAQSGIPTTPTILRQSISGAKWIYTNLDAAVQAADMNDILYLSGGTFHLTAPLTKKVVLYGTGYHADSSRAVQKTVIIRDFKLGVGANSSFFCGIQFKGNITTDATMQETIYWNRCRLYGIATTHSALFELRECIVGMVQLFGQSTLTASNTVFEQRLVANSGYLSVQNSIFLGHGDAQAQNDFVIKQFVSTEITNSIILLKNPAFLQGGTPNAIRNNLLVGSNDRIIGLDADASNVRRPLSDRDNIFIRRHDVYEEASDFHLKPNVDTTKGVYSGSIPHFRATPPVHISHIEIREQNQNTLNLKVKVRTNG
jgi:hypothetical protein